MKLVEKSAIPITDNKIKTINGVKNFPIKLTILDLFKANINTNAKYIELVSNELVPKKGCMAISCVADAVLGDGIAIEMMYTIMQ